MLTFAPRSGPLRLITTWQTVPGSGPICVWRLVPAAGLHRSLPTTAATASRPISMGRRATRRAEITAREAVAA